MLCLQSKVVYSALVLTLGVCTVIVSLWERFSEPSYRPLRAGVFMSFGLSGVIPGVHWVLSHNWIFSVHLRMSVGCLVLMAALYITGALLYAMRIPECYFPGKCDIWFHSHQLFHILVIAAAIVHYRGISEMAMYRLQGGDVCPSDGANASLSTTSANSFAQAAFA